MPGLATASRRGDRALGRQAGVAAFTPASLPGLVGWWKADALTGLSNTDPVSSWTASVGPALVQGTAGARPTYRTAAQNGLSVVRFDGTDDFLAAASTITPKHVLIAAKYSAATFLGYDGLFTGSLSTNPNEAVLLGELGTSHYFSAAAVGLTDAVYHYNGSNLPLAGMTAPMNAFGVMSLSSDLVATLLPQVGRDREITNRHWNGDVGEVIACSAVLSTANRQAAEAYLKAKWGTP